MDISGGSSNFILHKKDWTYKVASVVHCTFIEKQSKYFVGKSCTPLLQFCSLH